MYGIIATWRMALEGITKADEMLKNHGDAGDAIVELLRLQKISHIINQQVMGDYLMKK